MTPESTQELAEEVTLAIEYLIRQTNRDGQMGDAPPSAIQGVSTALVALIQSMGHAHEERIDAALLPPVETR